jgi:hypothetical protein
MSKTILSLAVASLAGLTSCFPPKPVPPPRYQPQGAYGRPPLPPYPPERGDYEGPARGDYNTRPDDYNTRPEPQPTQPSTPGNYPTARRTANPDQVLSPYEPFNVIDISGPPRFKSGQLARDPSNQKIFRIP